MKFRNMVKKYGARTVVYGSLLSPLAAFAQTSYDVTSVTAAITAAVTAILAIGAAVVAGPRIAIKVWKWIGRAL
jgi:hypothetical protein